MISVDTQHIRGAIRMSPTNRDPATEYGTGPEPSATATHRLGTSVPLRTVGPAIDDRRAGGGEPGAAYPGDRSRERDRRRK